MPFRHFYIMLSDSKGYKRFVESATQATALYKENIRYDAVADTDVLEDIDASRSCLNYILQNTLEHADEELQRFAKLFVNAHSHVLWAEDYSDMFAQLKGLFKQWQTKQVCFPQLQDSNDLNNQALFPLFHELGLPYFLQDEKLDIGETGEVQIFHPDLLLTDQGSMLFHNMDNTTLGMLNNNSINLFITTTTQLLNTTSMAELYSTYCHVFKEEAAGMRVIYRGTHKVSNYLLIVDNRRTAVLGHSFFRPILTCLQCGRCHKVCPVELAAGKEAYNNIFTGPVAHVMLPYLEEEKVEGYVVHACLLCGRCEAVCPLQLPIRDMVVAARHDLQTRKVTPGKARKLLEQSANFLQNRAAMNKGTFSKRFKFGKYVDSKMEKACGALPYAAECYNKQVEKKKH